MSTSSERPESSMADDLISPDAEEIKVRLVVTQVSEDRDACVQALCEILGWTSIDAKQRLRHVPSVWPDILGESSARRVMQRLNSIGAKVELLPVGDLPETKQARTLHHVRCTEAGFVIVPASGEAEAPVNWSDLVVLSVASVGGLSEKVDNPLPDGVFRHAGGIARYDDVPERYGLELWLIAENPARVWRIYATVMNYEYLGERLSSSTEENFALLVNDIRRFIPTVVLTPAAQAYVKGGSVLDYQLPSSQVHLELTLATFASQRGA